ncbi:PPOX class F420-dependent enzyme [Actinoplanes philippinensis]|uniref:PPOX class probable F420-dependent enzyme n=1 Tax=Actinoplanes philippinensis TaxID=35752 RepID=A0A1I2MB80_9ACTN|nr:TIGR03618 family F420-dependent PPOX class oxidoreductase [Actinoplanes philippinensis]GIE76376.1 PPOX class F420-dependent enzyme [Actinoplanes philippinensis]SFF88702.1 PPOX class probable F420-dependent enzyme [Actinoplanes philippinensis]
MALPGDLLDVLNGKAICFVTTLMPDGSPQISQTWAGTDGEHVLINTVDTHQKTRNIARDPRVAIGITDPAAPSRSWALRGSVVSATTVGAREHIDELSQKYIGRPYPGFGGGDQQRVLLTVKVDRVHQP